MNPNDVVQIHVIIKGYVQGVGFRFFVLEKANVLGIQGWVRNTISGQVEVLAEGTVEQINQFLELIKQGPRQALVTDIEIEKNDPSGEFIGFSLRNTA